MSSGAPLTPLPQRTDRDYSHPTMSNINELSIAQLKQAVAIKEQIVKLEGELSSLMGTSVPSAAPTKKKGGMSAAGRARVAAAQKKRWAKIKAGQPVKASTAITPTKRRMSAAGRAAISKAAKARWAKAKAAKK